MEQDIYIIIRVGTSWNTGNYTFRSLSDIISRIPFRNGGEERFASSSSAATATPSFLPPPLVHLPLLRWLRLGGRGWEVREVAVPERNVFIIRSTELL